MSTTEIVKFTPFKLIDESDFGHYIDSPDLDWFDKSEFMNRSFKFTEMDKVIEEMKQKVIFFKVKFLNLVLLALGNP